jgi:hypothetical protein
MAAPQDGRAQVFAVVTRVTTLDVNGFPAVGANVFTTNSLLKCSFAPAEETGVDLTTINANGDLYSHYKHGDMPKYYTVQIEIGTPDPILHQMLAGGTVLTASGTALGAPTGTITAVGQITLGTLLPATYGYLVTQFNQYGETVPTAEHTGTVASGTTGTMVVAGMVAAAGATGMNVYGRLPGGEQLLGSVPNIGSQATSAASGTGTVTSLSVTALTDAIPQGTTFQITGDTNTTKIVFTTTAPAGVGATALAVSASQSVTTTIAAAAIVPCFVDNGSIVPSGGYPSVDTTAGPGNDTGYAAAALGVVGNPNGVSLEFWGAAILGGAETPNLPYYRWVIPKVQNITEGGRTFQPAILENVYMGQGVQNPNWGAGPFGDWQFPSTQVYQYASAGRSTLPVAGFAPVPATA